MKKQTNLFNGLEVEFKNAIQGLKEEMSVVAIEGLELALKQQRDELLSDWINAEETFKYLGFGKTKMQELRTAGEIVWSKIGNALFYSKRSILELLNRNKRN